MWHENCFAFLRNSETFRADPAFANKVLVVKSRSQMKATVLGVVPSARTVSWLALVAATTAGVGSVHRVRAAVSADIRRLGRSEVGYRLVVQSYAPDSFGSRELPPLRSRPLASFQRSVTADELERGVSVELLGVTSTGDAMPVIVAWVERGRPDLEFDALEARPSTEAVYGVAAARQSEAAQETQIVLSRRRAA